MFFRVLEARAHFVTSEQSIQVETLEVLFAGLLRCVKKSFLGTAFSSGFLIEKGTKEPLLEQDGSLEKQVTHEPKQILALVGASVGSGT